MELFGDNEMMAVFVVPQTLAGIVYWINGFLLLALDLSGFGAKFRLQPKRPNKWDSEADGSNRNLWNWSNMYTLCKTILINQLFVTPIFALILWKGNWTRLTPVPPTHLECLYSMLIYSLLDEPLFYYGHRLLHHKSLYGAVHKMHHEFRAPVALAAIYCHPIEMMLSNVAPLFTGIMLLNSHTAMLVMWSILASLGTQTHHSGFDWPWTKFDEQPNFHDFHHEKFLANFGFIGVLDKFHRTDALYVAHLAKEKVAKSA